MTAPDDERRGLDARKPVLDRVVDGPAQLLHQPRHARGSVLELEHRLQRRHLERLVREHPQVLPQRSAVARVGVGPASTSPATRSGECAASSTATWTPMELPKKTARSMPAASSQARSWSVWSRTLGPAGQDASAGFGDRPKPGRSGAMTSYPSAASRPPSGTRYRLDRASPWSRTT
ncbi:MAG: hypothetical protein M3P95_03160 [Actinomycetota bacterium]|nr:hypothetical protein [Actinomycetota bacterium]